MINAERNARCRELTQHRKSLLESIRRDIEYALSHEDSQFAAPLSNNWINLIQIEQTLRTLRQE